MIKRLTTPYSYSKQEEDCITAAKQNWGSATNCIKALKAEINTHLDTHQGEKCCYCGLLYDRTGRGEIEHIAPKGADLYPQFSYTPRNLAKACQLCNSSSMKHTFNTVDAYDADYDKCTFKIVHPYLDDHGYHYKFTYGKRGVLIAVNNNSDKARESIKLFELDSEKRTRARATERNQEARMRFYGLTDAIKARIKAIMTFR